jgi:hypothetical protein
MKPTYKSKQVAVNTTPRPQQEKQLQQQQQQQLIPKPLQLKQPMSLA